MELKDIKAVIDLMKKNDLSVFEMEKDGFKLKLQKGAGDQTVFSAPGERPSCFSPIGASGGSRSSFAGGPGCSGS